MISTGQAGSLYGAQVSTPADAANETFILEASGYENQTNSLRQVEM